ncbi:Multidrug resistance protein pgp-1 [Cytospora mali]|uniref:Multidrug resistance protein pgp-1 n=1 Tax=Cytospora mali TaxID=578113 RepID=A0A194UUS0_CYTMA|nr:Multidrug resistance protein pgp-1 [Valsa mali var. pyri (nom. inval.)]
MTPALILDLADACLAVDRSSASQLPVHYSGKPKILILDEAMSALGAESDVLVQAALDAAAKAQTTAFVAHRLAGMVKAGVICCLVLRT